jgi:hypothetical protein
MEGWLPLWSSGQSSWLQIQRSGLDSRRYQIFWEVVSLERGPLSPVSTIKELLGRKVAAPMRKPANTPVEIPHADHVTRAGQGWHWLHRQAAVARSVLFARGLRPRRCLCLEGYEPSYSTPVFILLFPSPPPLVLLYHTSLRTNTISLYIQITLRQPLKNYLKSVFVLCFYVYMDDKLERLKRRQQWQLRGEVVLILQLLSCL